MIEATCGACGTVARIAETDVPAGAKFVNCASCKARVPLPQGAAGAKPPPKPVAIPPAIPRTPPPIPSMSNKPTVDLADLPAPKAKSALAGAGPSKPAAASPFAGADLPAPKGAKPSAAPSALDLDDLMGADLPAPKGKADPGLDLPAPKVRGSALGDAPASKPAPSALADLPAPKAKQSALADLPAPKGKSALADLPAPKSKGGGAFDDLPAPKSKGGGGAFDDDLDLPMPAGAGGFTDLPMPKPGANGDLPMPKPGANNDLPAPKGFFDDLPQPAKKSSQGSVDLPAPKGFFDDLPQPAMNNKPTVDLPAPKGFFDDLPQPAKPSQQPASGSAGFFDDLPQPAKGGKGGGLFDDIGGAAAKGKAAHAHANDLSLSDMELGPGSGEPLSLDPGPSGGPELDLGLPLGENADFTELDLSEPSGKDSIKAVGAPPPEDEASPIKIKTPKGGKPQAPIPITVKPKDDPKDLKLDLAEDPHEGKPGAAAAAGKGTAKKKGPSPEEAAELRAAKRKRSRIILASVLGVALVGGGGFYFYQQHAAKQERIEKIESGLGEARQALAGANPNHWAKASASAEEVLAIDPNNPNALSIAAEAAIAGALDNGANYDKRIAQGRTAGQKALGLGKPSDDVERAKALMSIAAGQADRAIPGLQALIANAGKKAGWLHVYMGWAQLVKGDAAAAQAAFSQAVALDPATTLPALYGDGQARLLKADIEGARVAFTKVTEHKDGKDHIGAQVGLAATLPPQQSAQREAELVAILNRPNLDKADPRAVVKAWVLAGDVARQSGRLDIARERYRKALAITPLELPALTGLANVELRDGKTQVARDLLTKALTAKPDDAEAQLLDGFADVIEGKLSDAASKFDKLAARDPKLPTLQLARLHVAKGRLLEAQGKSEEAITEYTEGSKLAGDLDLTPTMAAVTTLTELAKKAPDEATAMGYSARADEMLSKLAEKAREDGEVALTLGVAYLEAGNATKAQEMLQRAVTLRDKDVESRLQLAKALSALKRTDEAIASLKEALALDPKRSDVALELARTYQNAERHNEAVATYEKLLAEENVDVVVRGNAGRYFASRGAFDKAAAQSEPILKVEPQNATGLYLKGEGLILAKKWDDARIALTRATDLDQTDAQALDALGRAFEGSLVASGDTKFIEGARHAYDRATKANPKMFHPFVGLGHALINQLHYDEAIKPLQSAIQLNKTSSEVMYNMGLAYYGLRSKSPVYKKTAAEWFENALRGQPELSLAERAETNYKLGDLYFDLNKPPQSAGAFDQATKLGEQMEKELGVAPKWLTETYYRLGQVYEGFQPPNRSAQKKAWQRFIDRNPPPNEEKKAAIYWLGTTGKSF